VNLHTRGIRLPSRTRAGRRVKIPVVAVHGLARITVSVGDLDRALALYRDALGLVEQDRQGDVVMLAIAGGGAQVLLHRRAPQPSMAGVAASLLVDDVDDETAAAVAAGARVLDAPADQAWGERQSVLTDADGHVLCLVAPTRGNERPGT
jgi:catechol 2,3-dioxygenase-like lactoylglutathione lyase family enzyme